MAAACPDDSRITKADGASCHHPASLICGGTNFRRSGFGYINISSDFPFKMGEFSESGQFIWNYEY
jgi:hypothetical protein